VGVFAEPAKKEIMFILFRLNVRLLSGTLLLFVC
jgi:hypothetical protein